MRRSTRIIIALELASLLLVLSSSWLPLGATLRLYLQAGILGLAVLAGRLALGWSKPRGVENTAASTILILSGLVFQLALFILLGIKLGFVMNVYRWNWASLIHVFLPVSLVILFTETLRGQMIAKGHGSRGIIILTAVVLPFLQAFYLPAYLPLTVQSFCELTLTLVLPALLTSILLTYLAYAYDYRANIVFQLVMVMPAYLLPIYPDADVYLQAAFRVILIVVLILGFFSHRKLGERLADPSQKSWRQRRLSDIGLRWLRRAKYVGATVVIAGLLIFAGLMSGLFHHFFLAIGSGSMAPEISRGDLILVEKTSDYAAITAGMVLVYQYKNLVVVHRVSEASYDGKAYQYKTKGDANASEDIWLVEQGDVIGVAKGKISILGYPTIWLNELFNGGK